MINSNERQMTKTGEKERVRKGGKETKTKKEKEKSKKENQKPPTVIPKNMVSPHTHTHALTLLSLLIHNIALTPHPFNSQCNHGQIYTPYVFALIGWYREEKREKGKKT